MVSAVNIIEHSRHSRHKRVYDLIDATRDGFKTINIYIYIYIGILVYISIISSSGVYDNMNSVCLMLIEGSRYQYDNRNRIGELRCMQGCIRVLEFTDRLDHPIQRIAGAVRQGRL